MRHLLKNTYIKYGLMVIGIVTVLCGAVIYANYYLTSNSYSSDLEFLGEGNRELVFDENEDVRTLVKKQVLSAINEGGYIKQEDLQGVLSNDLFEDVVTEVKDKVDTSIANEVANAVDGSTLSDAEIMAIVDKEVQDYIQNNSGELSEISKLKEQIRLLKETDSNISQRIASGSTSGKNGTNGKDGAPGLQGAPGTPGKDGVGATVTKSGDTTTIKASNGTVTVKDGKDGKDGATGKDGKNGTTVTTSKTGNTTTITTADADGSNQKTVSIRDGETPEISKNAGVTTIKGKDASGTEITATISDGTSTYVFYADDNNGTNSSLTQTNHSQYMQTVSVVGDATAARALLDNSKWVKYSSDIFIEESQIDSGMVDGAGQPITITKVTISKRSN